MPHERGRRARKSGPGEGESGAVGGEDATLEEQLVDLIDSFVARRLKGERPSISEFAKKAPELSQRIHELFPALELLGEVESGSPDEEAAEHRGKVSKPSQELGDYRLLREVGRGGMGVIYEAEQRSLRRRVALKILPFHALTDSRYLHRFQLEARAAASLQHPGIVPIYGLGEHEGVDYYAMQFVEGESLDRIIPEVRQIRSSSRGNVRTSSRTSSMALAFLKDSFEAIEAEEPPAEESTESPETRGRAAEGGPEPSSKSPPRIAEDLTLPQAAYSAASPDRYFRCVVRVIRDVADATNYAHDRGVLHRDIKPSNVIVDTQGHAWVTDFGLAKAKEGDDLTRTGELVGTLRYMAPERFQGTCDIRSEVYSLGLTLYELLTTEPAFSDTDRAKLYTSVTERSPLRPRQIEPRIPRELERIVLKSIQRVPEDRYQSAIDMAQDLARYLEGRPVLARLPLPGRSFTAFVRRRWKAVSLVLALLLATAGVLAWRGAIHRPIGVQHLVVKDIDGDGDADVVTANGGSDSVSILLNDGNGALSLAEHLAVGACPISVAAADLDGNGTIDLVTANFRAGTVSVLRNTGGASYSRGTDIDIGVLVNFVAAADLDGDGHQDLVVTTKSAKAYVLQNHGDATFAKPAPLETPTAPNSVVPCDVDNDEDLDLVMGYLPDSSAGKPPAPYVSVYYNDREDTFSRVAHLDVAGPPWQIVPLDLDGDDYMDLAAVYFGGTAFVTLTNQGDGSFSKEARQHTVRSNIQSITAGDFDGDGRVDVAVAGGASPGYVAVLRGKGDGSFESPLDLSGAENPTWIEVADLDGDKDLDLVVSHYSSSDFSVFLNDDGGNFGEHRTVPLSSWWLLLSH